MDSLVQIKLMLPGDLMEHVNSAVAQQGMSQVEFFIEATKNELIRIQQIRTREEIALIEIKNDILADGESVNIVAEDGESGPDSLFVQCEMCHDLLPAPSPGVQGPYFCTRCMGIAKGANFQGLEP
jgi:hypothetical protein